MNKHPYLRAYMAGIAVPTFALLFVMTAYTVFRYVYNFPAPVERFIVFPMAVVPNLWGYGTFFSSPGAAGCRSLSACTERFCPLCSGHSACWLPLF